MRVIVVQSGPHARIGAGLKLNVQNMIEIQVQNLIGAIHAHGRSEYLDIKCFQVFGTGEKDADGLLLVACKERLGIGKVVTCSFSDVY